MAKKTAPLLPAPSELLERLGERLRAARLRRKLPAKQVAERAGMAPMTLRSVERGGVGVTMGAYLSVMQVLGIEKDLELVGKADPFGRELQDAQLPGRRMNARIPSLEATTSAEHGLPARRSNDGGAERASPLNLPTKPTPAQLKQVNDDENWMAQGAFASGEALSGLIDLPAVVKPKKR